MLQKSQKTRRFSEFHDTRPKVWCFMTNHVTLGVINTPWTHSRGFWVVWKLFSAAESTFLSQWVWKSGIFEEFHTIYPLHVYVENLRVVGFDYPQIASKLGHFNANPVTPRGLETSRTHFRDFWVVWKLSSAPENTFLGICVPKVEVLRIFEKFNILPLCVKHQRV